MGSSDHEIDLVAIDIGAYLPVYTCPVFDSARDRFDRFIVGGRRRRVDGPFGLRFELGYVLFGVAVDPRTRSVHNREDVKRGRVRVRQIDAQIDGRLGVLAAIGRDEQAASRNVSCDGTVGRQRQHRHVGSSNHPFGDAPEENPMQTAPTTRWHHDQVDVVDGRIGDDRLGDAPLDDLGYGVDVACTRPFFDVVDDLFAFTFEYVDDLATESSDTVVGRIGHVEDVERRVVGRRQVEDRLHDCGGPFAAVGGKENRIEHVSGFETQDNKRMTRRAVLDPSSA